MRKNSDHKPLPDYPTLCAMFDADPETGTLTNRKTGTVYSSVIEGTQKSMQVFIEGKMYLISRILYKMYTGRDPGKLVVDHINRDRSDNRACNLRAISHSENNLNRKCYGASGHRGVYLGQLRKDGTHRYYVMVHRLLGQDPETGKPIRKTFHYGSFEKLEDAVARAAEVHAQWGVEEFMPADDFRANADKLEPVAELPVDPDLTREAC